MLLEILPSQLYNSAPVKVLLRNKSAAIMHKVLDADLLDKEMFLATGVMLYIIKGRQILCNYDGSRVEVAEGQLLYLPKDMYVVSDFVTGKGEFEAVLFFFDDEFIEQQLRVVSHRKNPQRLIPTLKSSSQIQDYIRSLLLVYSNSKNSQDILPLKQSELFALIRLQKGGDDFLAVISESSRPKEKRDICEFMKANYLKNLNVEDYAILTGRSKSTFIREFKMLYDATPNQWLIEQRLEKAHALLSETDLNVTDTAFEVGYDNVSHFISAYKKKYSLTPKQQKRDTLTRISY